MSRIKLIAGSGLAVLIVSMSASAVAQALPEWQKAKKPLTEALHFKSHGSTGQLQEGTVHISWGSVTGKGSIEGSNKISNLSLIFGESWVSGLPKECAANSPGAKSGEVKTTELKGSIGYLVESSKLVGALVAPASGTIVTEIEGTCLPGKVTVTGSVIGRVVSELNKPIASVNVNFSVSSGSQEYKHFEKESTEHSLVFNGKIEGAALFECTREQFELEGGKKAEIKA